MVEEKKNIGVRLLLCQRTIRLLKQTSKYNLSLFLTFDLIKQYDKLRKNKITKCFPFQMCSTIWGKFLEVLSLITVEPTMTLYMMAFMITTVLEQAFFVDKACRVNHKFNSTICDNITAYKDYNSEVQVRKLHRKSFQKVFRYFGNPTGRGLGDTSKF